MELEDIMHPEYKIISELAIVKSRITELEKKIKKLDYNSKDYIFDVAVIRKEWHDSLQHYVDRFTEE